MGQKKLLKLYRNGILEKIRKITEKLYDWDDLWISYAVSSLEMEMFSFYGKTNLEILENYLEEQNISRIQVTNATLLLVNKLFFTKIGLLREDYSPEQISGYCKKENLECVSHERIYQYIWSDKKAGGELYKHLRRKGRRYRKRGNKKRHKRYN